MISNPANTQLPNLLVIHRHPSNFKALQKTGDDHREHRNEYDDVHNKYNEENKVREKANADGKGVATYDFTSLMGSAVLIGRLPAKLEVFELQTSNTVITLLKVFYSFI